MYTFGEPLLFHPHCFTKLSPSFPASNFPVMFSSTTLIIPSPFFLSFFGALAFSTSRSCSKKKKKKKNVNHYFHSLFLISIFHKRINNSLKCFKIIIHNFKKNIQKSLFSKKYNFPLNNSLANELNFFQKLFSPRYGKCIWTNKIVTKRDFTNHSSK